MKELNDLVYLITSYKVQEVNVITNPKRQKVSASDQRYWDFYQRIQKNRYKTDEEAAAAVGMNASDKAFQRLKNGLKDRLLSTMFFIDMDSEFDCEYVVKERQQITLLAQASVLFSRNAMTAFMEIARRCLKLALETENVANIIFISDKLSAVALSRPQWRSEFEKYLSLFRDYIPHQTSENYLRAAYKVLMNDLSIRKGYKKEYAPQADAIVAQFEEDAKRYTNPGFQAFYRLTLLYSKSLRHHWAEALMVTEEAIQFFYSKKHPCIFYIALFLNQKINFLTMLKRHEEAEKAVQENLKISVEGDSRWFKCHLASAANSFFAGWYRRAWDTTNMMLRHERFDQTSLHDQETWKLYYGYLRVLVQLGKIELSAEERNNLKKLRLSTLLNDLNILSADKQGKNIPVQLLQIHYHLAEKNFDEVDNRIEAFIKYTQRNTGAEYELYRTKKMVDLLRLLQKYMHDACTLQAKAAPVLADMATVSADLTDQTYEIEIVPYPDQWEWMIKALLMEKKAVEE